MTDRENRPRDGAALLGFYRAAWEPALWAVRLCAGLEALLGGVFGIRLWPARWRLAQRLDTGTDGIDTTKTIWMHAASLGECKGLWAFAQTLRASLPENSRILLTTNTTTGLDFLQNQISKTLAPETFHARLAPPDHPRLAKRFLRACNIRALVLFEVELWPHWIFAARKAEVPVFWISARLTERARRRYAGSALFSAALRRVLQNIAWIQAQTAEEAETVRALGGDAETGGDLRGLYYLREHARKPSAASTPEAARRGTAFVSLHAQELPALLPKITAAGTETPIKIFPRNLNELPIFMKALAPHGFALHSRNPNAERVIVDSFGRVAEALSQVRTAVIGGSFGDDDRIGGHNLWEPLLAGARIEIGPHHANQRYLARKLRDAENAREEFIAREDSVLKHAAQEACEHILKAVNTG